MTAFGKILVFLNLVASIAVAAFIVMVYAARTNWAASANEWKARATSVEATANATIGEYNERLAAADKQRQDLEARLKQTSDALAVEKGKVAAKDNELAAARQLATSESATKSALEADLGRHKDEVLKLAQALKDKDDQIVRLAREKNDLRDEQVRASIEAGRFKVRVEQLASHLQELTRENERIRRTGGGNGTAPATAAAENPPPGNVEGLIKQTDPTGLVTITIGSDAGLAKGHTLDVYRLNPTPEYLGMVRLTDVRPNEAVGQLLRRSKAPVKLGDRVGTLNTKG